MSSAIADRRQTRLAWPQIPVWSAGEIVVLLTGLALAIFLRVVALDQIPPGMQHDEVFDARFAKAIYNGAWPVFFDENFGVAPLFMYLVSVSFRLLGLNVWALRLTAVTVGVAGLLVNYLLLRELFGRLTAQIVLIGLVISFWHLFDSRVGLEPITIPLLAGLSFYALWRALRSGAVGWYIAAGISLGLAPYGYHSGPLIPLTAFLFAGYLLLFRRPWLRGERGAHPWQRAALGFLLAFLIAGLVMLPLTLHILGNANVAGERVRTLSHHLTLFLAGQPGPLLGDVAGVLGMFFLRGDPEWRYNVAGRPVFDPLSGLLFLIGLGLALSRSRRPEYFFLLLWLPVNLLTAAITPPSPSSLRALGSIVPIYTLPALTLVALWEWTRRQGRPAALGALFGLLFGLFAGNLIWTVRDYFFVWPRNSVARAVYRADLALAARYLDATRPAGPVLISAQFAADLDQQTFDYLQRHKRFVKWFDGQRAFPIPADYGDQAVLYLFPATNPAPPAILSRLEPLGPSVERFYDPAGGIALSIYRLTPAQMDRLRAIQPRYPLDLNLGDEVDLLGYDLPAQVRAGDSIPLAVYWRVRRGGRGEITYAFFAHVLDRRGFRWAQDDPTGFPSHSWQAGDLVVQSFALRIPVDAPPAEHELIIGVYEPRSGTRLVVPGSRDNALRLRPLHVVVSGQPVASEGWRPRDRIEVEFAGRLKLLGYTIPDRILDLEEKIEIALTWQALAGGAPDVLLELTLIGEKGETLPPLRRALLDGDYPLSQWAAGQIVRDRFWLEHTADIPRAIYELRLSIFDAAGGMPLGESVSLGKVFMRGLK